MSKHTVPGHENLQAAARTVITTLAGATDPQRLLQHCRSLHTAVTEMEAMLTDAPATEGTPGVSCGHSLT
ncbi:hypothetical protein SGFS_001040 [Streptomyces graminofaciens]|uniref:Uncharacterized protein n=1 Tax=Streptomyces graminofaciens TaxID=68212 RepID=A0ABM7F000_9ACTN|nr:hypothetical protein [Streptomyces graminofaciens]BBC28813.1 hypothetical protein SGFS_001040 [Streptomyces graminofaciens]